MSFSADGKNRVLGKVAIVTGGSRGIGREVCLALARAGAKGIVIAAKSIKPKPNLPGSIFTVAKEVEALGCAAMPYQLDVRDADGIEECVAATIKRFGRIDILVNNASSLWWHTIEDTPMKKYDLITQINSRGSFALARACMKHMKRQGFGRVICMSPPITLNQMAGHTAYNISKFGMTLVALGVAAEGKDHGVTGNALWPATIIESQASINFKLAEASMWRKGTILADAVVGICQQPDSFSGNQLIDDEFLRYCGLKDEDFVKYRCVPDVEPPRLLDARSMEASAIISMPRGDIRKVQEDMRSEKISSKL